MPTTARYSLDGPVLPLVQATLPLAEAAHCALMSRYRKLKEIERYGRTDPPNAERFASLVFSGKDAQGLPLRNDHDHAFYLSTDEDGDGRLDHLTVFAHGGFPPDEVRALDAFRSLRCGDLDLSLLLVGLGQQADFRHTQILGHSAVWTSATPFLVTRHMKRRGQKRDPASFSRRPREGPTSSNRSCAKSWNGAVCEKEPPSKPRHSRTPRAPPSTPHSLMASRSSCSNRLGPSIACARSSFACGVHASRVTTDRAGRGGSFGSAFRNRSPARSRWGTRAISAWGCICGRVLNHGRNRRHEPRSVVRPEARTRCSQCTKSIK